MHLLVGDRLMGFGHRVYKTEDPRAEELREMARIADPQQFALARKVEELALALLDEQKPGRRLYTNVEFYSAVVLSSVGLPGRSVYSHFCSEPCSRLDSPYSGAGSKQSPNPPRS